MSRKHRLLVAVVLLLVVAGGFVWGTFWKLVQDDPPLSLDDLRVVRRQIPDERNGWTCFERAAQKLQWPESEDETEKIDEICKEKSWDPVFVETLLSRNQDALADLERGLACEASQCAVNLESKSVIEADEILTARPELNMKLSHLLVFQFLAFQHADKIGPAVRKLVEEVRFGHLQETSGISLVESMFGISIKMDGLSRLRSLLAENRVATEDLRSQNEALGGYPFGFSESLKTEFWLFANTVDGYNSGKYVSEALKKRGVPAVPKPLFLTIALKPNRTKLISATHARAAIHQATHHHMEQFVWPSGSERFQDLGLYIHAIIDKSRFNPGKYDNILGNILLATLGSIKVGKVKCRANVSLGATRLLMALRCYKNETGLLPDLLDPLVPAYISSLPLDDFDGKPLRYSRQKGILWSVGQDGVDSGGSSLAKEKWEEDETEPTYEIPFK